MVFIFKDFFYGERLVFFGRGFFFFIRNFNLVIFLFIMILNVFFFVLSLLVLSERVVDRSLRLSRGEIGEDIV